MVAPTKEFYTPKEVSDITGLGLSTIRKLIKDNKLPARKLGGSWLISIKTLRAMLEVDDSPSGE